VSEHSAIEWTDATWNPATGCTKVSPGCEHCYAETFAERWRGVAGHPYEQGFDVRLWPARLALPLRWRTPRRIFVNSMSDLFHPSVPDEFIAAVIATIAAAHWHTFQVLTKRHGRMRALFTSPHFHDLVRDHADYAGWYAARDRAWPLGNLWLGVSAETQQWADIRVPALLATPAAVRFVSAEPLLGPIDVGRYLGIEWSEIAGEWLPEMFATLRGDRPGIDWVITGGESGPRARPMHPGWPGSLRDQCATAAVTFFFKQWGAWTPDLDGPGRLARVHPDGTVTGAASHRAADDASVLMRRTGKKTAGRTLDGRTHDQLPATAAARRGPASPGGPGWEAAS
jgi:protein gp37